MEMGDNIPHHQYGGLADLRQFIAGRAHFPGYPPPLPTDQFSVAAGGGGHRHNIPSGATTHYEMVMLGSSTCSTHRLQQQQLHHLHDQHHQQQHFLSDSTTTTTTTTTTNNSASTSTTNANTTSATAAVVCGLEMDGCIGGDQLGGNARWPRQETLTLLEIRSRLDSKFKEANQKGPLWDEVSRIMAEQHGYQRSGKKCREKFENLYKYYKKTKEGKSGRQDGKHYRFFRQLEALYGDNTSNNNPISVNNNIPLQPSNIITNYSNQEIMQAHKFCESQSISISSEFDTSSSEDSDNNDLDITTAITLRDQNEALMEKKKNKLVMIKDNVQSLKRGRKSWKAKIRDFIDTQMKKLIETQEAWLEKMLKTLEQKEQERMMREEEWRKQEEARIDQEHKFWAKERSWFEARDAALMEALKKFTGKEVAVRASSCANNVEEEEKEEERFESCSDINRDNYRWQEAEISSLIHIKNSMESRFQQEEDADEGALWEEISEKLACLGYDRNWKSCKEKWEDVNKYLTRRSKECNKKRKENAKMGSYLPNLGSIISDQAHDHSDHHHHHHHHHNHHHQETSCHVGQVCNSTAGIMQDSCFRFLMTEGEQQNNLWENYCVVKFNKEENQQ